MRLAVSALAAAARFALLTEGVAWRKGAVPRLGYLRSKRNLVKSVISALHVRPAFAAPLIFLSESRRKTAHTDLRRRLGITPQSP
jgi:hypothetical protein